MDPFISARNFLGDNIGHLARPGKPSFDSARQRWLVPVCYRTGKGDQVVGQVEPDLTGSVLFATSREEMLSRLQSQE
jgi:hypothetical protein